MEIFDGNEILIFNASCSNNRIIKVPLFFHNLRVIYVPYLHFPIHVLEENISQEKTNIFSTKSEQKFHQDVSVPFKSSHFRCSERKLANSRVLICTRCSIEYQKWKRQHYDFRFSESVPRFIELLWWGSARVVDRAKKID